MSVYEIYMISLTRSKLDSSPFIIWSDNKIVLIHSSAENSGQYAFPNFHFYSESWLLLVPLRLGEINLSRLVA
jgi:hypothetical protein